MWRFALLLVLPLPLAACDEHHAGGPLDDHWVDATVKVDGAFVVLTARCTERYGTEAVVVEPNYKFHCDREGKPQRIPAAKFGGAGHKELTLGDEYRRMPPVKLAVDIPATALVPYFTVASCALDATATAINLGVAVDGGPEVDCWTSGGARAQLSISATPGAAISIAGRHATVPPSGQVDMVAELGDSFLDLSIDEAIATGDGNPIVVPYKLATDGKDTSGKLSFTTKFGQHAKLVARWLHDIADGKIDRPHFRPVDRGARATAILLPVLGEPYATDRRGTLGDLGLLAVAKPGTRTEHGTCQLEDKHDGKGTITAKRFLVEHVVDVIRLADGKTVAHKGFAAPPDDCPFIAFVKPDHPEVENTPSSRDLQAWLDTLTTAKLE